MDDDAAAQARADFDRAFKMIAEHTSAGIQIGSAFLGGNKQLRASEPSELARGFGLHELASDIERRSIALSAATASKRGQRAAL